MSAYTSPQALSEGLAQRQTESALSEGQLVQWPGGQGVIEHLMLGGVLGTPGSPFAIEATESDPAALIRIYRNNRPTEYLVGKRSSQLNKTGQIGI